MSKHYHLRRNAVQAFRFLVDPIPGWFASEKNWKHVTHNEFLELVDDSPYDDPWYWPGDDVLIVVALPNGKLEYVLPDHDGQVRYVEPGDFVSMDESGHFAAVDAREFAEDYAEHLEPAT